MTVIVGIVDKKTKKVYMGADKGYFEDDETHYISPEPKILKKKIGEYDGKPIYMIIGGAGDVKPWNIITPWKTRSLNFDPSKTTPHDFMMTVFAPRLKKLLEDKGYKGAKNDFAYLIGFEGQIFKIQSDYAVIIPPDYGAGIGSASVPAIGVLWALEQLKTKVPPRKKIRLALEAAIAVSVNAKGPIDILAV